MIRHRFTNDPQDPDHLRARQLVDDALSLDELRPLVRGLQLWEGKGPIKPDPYLLTFGFSEFWLR